MAIKFIQLGSRFIPENQILKIEAVTERSVSTYFPCAKVIFLSGVEEVIRLSRFGHSSDLDTLQKAIDQIKQAIQND